MLHLVQQVVCFKHFLIPIVYIGIGSLAIAIGNIKLQALASEEIHFFVRFYRVMNQR